MTKRITERYIRKTLRRLARQRVAAILQPGNHWLIEYAIGHDELTDSSLRTCYMRGWVEPLRHAVPHATVGEDGSLPPGPEGISTMWRLTEAGWGEIHRTGQMTIMGVWVALAALLAAVLTYLLGELK